ncbi:MAG: Holliday junction resolvase RuvX [Patescibacteria group bacterium]
MKILGIDYGRKHVGLAVTDEEGKMAFPYKTLEVTSRKKLFQDLEKIVEFEGILKSVVGLPLTLKGAQGAASSEVQKFVCELEEFLNVPVETVDERFTTAEAKKKNQGKSADEHALAAQLLLDTYLNNTTGHSPFNVIPDQNLPRTEIRGRGSRNKHNNID